MKIYDKLKAIRHVKGWSQEEVAERLAMSVNGYANIERGETDIPFSRLEKIADVFEIDLVDLFGVNEKNIFNFVGGKHSNHSQHWYGDSSIALVKLQHENEKLHLLIEQQAKEIDLLKQQNQDLRDVILLLKQQDSNH